MSIDEKKLVGKLFFLQVQNLLSRQPREAKNQLCLALACIAVDTAIVLTIIAITALVYELAYDTAHCYHTDTEITSVACSSCNWLLIQLAEDTNGRDIVGADGAWGQCPPAARHLIAQSSQHC